ncbi:hypothetical protein BGZ99_006143 [Dissophora globulifera]|uniref:Uncharacterized protein n=1 Tax=Dissophora globulifera TaxID=979702 RepID=A0A9P6RX38_9FUNG|nr:hypothetical protein BGZ99_006143 [Dissophora globulifera]
MERPRPPPAPGPHTTRRKLEDVMTLYTPPLVMSVFHYNKSFTVIDIDPGIHDMATATVINSQNEKYYGQHQHTSISRRVLQQGFSEWIVKDIERLNGRGQSVAWSQLKEKVIKF